MIFIPRTKSPATRFAPAGPLPFGATLVPGGVNFSIFSNHATSCSLVLFEKGARIPLAELPFPLEFCIGNVFAMIVFDLDCETIEYGYRMNGPWDPARGLRFDETKILSDPYARMLGGRAIWGVEPDWTDPYQHRARLAFDDFDWQGDLRPKSRWPTWSFMSSTCAASPRTNPPRSNIRAPTPALSKKFPT